MPTYEQTDGFIPNKQTPPSTSTIGTSADKFDEIHVTTLTGTTVSGTTVGAGTAAYVGGQAVARYYSESVDLPQGQYNITHGLNNANPVIQVYGSGTNEILPHGSGNGVTVVAAASGSGVNVAVITLTAAVPGATVVIVG